MDRTLTAVVMLLVSAVLLVGCQASPQATPAASPAPAVAPSPTAAAPVAVDDFVLGRLLLEEGRLADALAAYTRAAESHPDTAAVYAGVARVHVARGDWAAAAEAYRAVLLIDPQNADTREALAVCHERLGDPARAERIRSGIEDPATAP